MRHSRNTLDPRERRSADAIAESMLRLTAERSCEAAAAEFGSDRSRARDSARRCGEDARRYRALAGGFNPAPESWRTRPGAFESFGAVWTFAESQAKWALGDSMGAQPGIGEWSIGYARGFHDAMRAIQKRCDVDAPGFARCRRCGAETRYRDHEYRARCGSCG